MFGDLGVDDLSGAIVLVVHAHPDDEVFATGAAVIAAKAAGARTHLRIFTGGEGRDSLLTPSDLASARRAKETRLVASAGLLGIDTWDYLTEPGRWTDTPHAPARTIGAAATADIAAPVRTALEALCPDIVLTVGPDGLTGHPDHIACHHAVAHALATAIHRPRVALGAVLDQRSVRAAAETARAVTGRPVGSGRVTGMALDTSVITVTGPPGTDDRRRRALDAYVPGLGTSNATDVDTERMGTGDSVLLRFILDTDGWTQDHFVPLRVHATWES
ncbi:PIG-L deacetylase family protein [Nocardioides sp. NPDC051685]|uniref:PIG-L deacetylase family protein n=1 Tax=Nocardioides sp. NPDC051685 TaxID=3364334 RepID=UPI00379979C6